VETIAELTGVSVSKRSLEQMLPDLAQDFDAFYRQRPPDAASGSLLVAAVDCKGIPVVKPVSPQPAFRLTKGQKANKKRMATVAAVFTPAPWVRTPPQVSECLFPSERRTRADRAAAPRPENKRVWASLVKSKSAVIEEVAAEMDRRDPVGLLTRIALPDGERALQIRVKSKLRVTLILDLMHVLEKLWKAAYVFHAEGSLEADLWVLERTLRILDGRVSQVIKGLRQSITKRRLVRHSPKDPAGRSGLLLQEPLPHALRRIPFQGLAHCQRPGRRSLQGPHGTIRNALDRSHGRVPRQTPRHLPLWRLRPLLGFPHPAGSATAISGAMDRRSKVATPNCVTLSITR
jgi:hypothetical protein